jgi:regulator of cell morphogenesis and NO signaling
MKKVISIGEIVANDFRAAGIFREEGIDFCCGGEKSIDNVCLEKGIDKTLLMEKLSELQNRPADPSYNFNEWEPEFLCTYIVRTHHSFVIRTIPELLFYTEKIASVHGERHPELAEVASLFSELAMGLTQHLKTEEEIFFPAIIDFTRNPSGKQPSILTVSMDTLLSEHESAGSTMDRIHSITSGFTVPADGCNIYKVTMDLLHNFEDDLHIHVHLENNVLFKKLKAYHSIKR